MRQFSEAQTQKIVEHYRSELRRYVAGRRWIVGDGVLVGAGRAASVLMTLGAEAVLAIGASRGSGDLPDDEKITLIDLELESSSIMSGIRLADQGMKNLPPSAKQAIEAFDPEGTASSVGAIWMTIQDIEGRPMLGARPAAWQALEDKMTCDALWERAGIEHSPYRLVPAKLSQLKAAAAEVESKLGSVWVGDNTEGWHGGASMTKWARDPEAQVVAAQFLEKHCHRARVMPFLDGLPCSIHAIVTDTGVATIRPCELLIFRDSESSTLYYAGSATNWRPSKPIAQKMHEAALRVAKTIHAELGYRGTFTLDGVCTGEAFLPTEINPRFGAALGRMASCLPDIPLDLVHHAIVSHDDFTCEPQELADLIAFAAENSPIVRGMGIVPKSEEIAPEQVFLRKLGEEWRPAQDEDDAQATITIGPATAGQFVHATIYPGVIPVGAPAAPDVASLLNFAISYWNIDHPLLLPSTK